jgi:hypothetical protein
MKRSLILLLSICALVLAGQLPGSAQGVSFGIPLPFPFLFYNLGPHPCYARPVRYYRSAYWACPCEYPGFSGYYGPNYCGADP